MTREEEIINAATEARMASAETLTPRGTHISIDDVPFVDKIITYDEVAESAFIKGAQWADNHPKSPWISVKDDLPCNHKELIETIGTITGVPALIATQNRVILGIRIKSKDDKWHWCDNSTTLSPMIEEVMFWMPIPKPPKE